MSSSRALGASVRALAPAPKPLALVPEMPPAQVEELMQALKENLARKTAERERAAAEARQAEMFDLMRQAQEERKAKRKPDGEPS
jgi:hypothetical protein